MSDGISNMNKPKGSGDVGAYDPDFESAGVH